MALERYRVHVIRMVQQEDFIEVEVDPNDVKSGASMAVAASMIALERARAGDTKWDDVRVAVRRVKVQDSNGATVHTFRDSGEIPL